MKFHEFGTGELLRALWRGRRGLALWCAGGCALGFLLACCMPKEYTSSASIIPENGERETGLSAVANMAGLDLGEGEDAIGPELYPTVVVSDRFIARLLYTEVSTVDGSLDTDLLTYLRKHTRRPWWAYGTIALGKLMRSLNPPPQYNARPEGERIDPERMSYDDELLMERLKGDIDCRMDDKTGVINITFRSQDPLVAKTVVDTLMLRLQEFITDYRTSKARNDLEHYRLIERETRRKYQEAQRDYAEYCDRHLGTLMQTYQSEAEALETELGIELAAYTAVKQQVQAAEAKVQERTPAFTVVETAAVPPRHSAPRKLLTAIAAAFLGLALGAARVYLRLLLREDVA